MFFARYAEAILGTVLVSISGLLLGVLIPLAVQVPKSNKVLALSPDFWMKIVVWITLALGAYILAKGISRARHELTADETVAVEEDLAHRHPPLRGIVTALVCIVGLFAYYYLIIWIGMVAASVIAMFGFMMLCGERRLKIALPISIILPIALYYFFLKVASIPMPLGIFE